MAAPFDLSTTRARHLSANCFLHMRLWKYLAEYCAIRLGRRHVTYSAINEISRIFTAEDEIYRTKLLNDCLHSITNAFKDSNGYYDVLRLWRQDPGLTWRRDLGYSIHLESWDRDHTHSTKAPGLGEFPDKERFQASSLLDRCRTKNWECPTAYSRSIALLTQPGAREDATLSPYMEWHCLYEIARFHRARCEKVTVGDDAADYKYHHDLARSYLRWAVNLDTKHWRPTKDYYESILLLQQWCHEAGQIAHFNELEALKIRCVESLLQQWGIWVKSNSNQPTIHQTELIFRNV
ncbi:hypothetical protein PG984_011766 [Apiospora sp. TS-2023a]